MRRLGGSELSRIHELMTTDHGEREGAIKFAGAYFVLLHAK